MTTPGEYARFEPLSEQDVIDLLRTHEVGRVAWNSAEGLAIVPVAYAFARGALAFRTAPDGSLAELADHADAAFQTDEFDVETATGWSVLVRAVASRVTEPTEVADWLSRLPAPWAPGVRDVVIRLDPVLLTGRTVVRG